MNTLKYLKKYINFDVKDMIIYCVIVIEVICCLSYQYNIILSNIWIL